MVATCLNSDTLNTLTLSSELVQQSTWIVNSHVPGWYPAHLDSICLLYHCFCFSLTFLANLHWLVQQRQTLLRVDLLHRQPTNTSTTSTNQLAHTPAFHALDWLSLPVMDSEYNTKWLMAVEWQWADSSVIENKQMVRLKQHFFSVIAVDMSHKSVTTFKLPPFYIHYTGQPALASTPSYELENFVGAKHYCCPVPACSCWQQLAHLD